jgi:hypothetical protein
MSTTAPPQLSAEELAKNKQNTLWAPQIVTFTLASVAVGLRIASRRLTGVKFGWDDYFIFLSYVS